MPDFTITKARNAGEKDNPHGGKLVRWYIGLQDAPSGNEEVYVQKKPGNDLSSGMEISGRLEKGEYGWRLFPEQQQDNFTPPTTFYKGGGDPQAERSRRIERQHSQEMALRAIAFTEETYRLPESTDHLRTVIADWTDFFAEDLDAEIGSSQAALGASVNNPSGDGDAADLSAGNCSECGLPQPGPHRGTCSKSLMSTGQTPIVPEEASRSLKGDLTKAFHKAGLSRDAMKAVVMWRCGQEKATKQGASQLITDLQEGATHDVLLAEIYDAKRAGNPLGARAAALIPSEVPWTDDGSLPDAPKDEEGIPF